MIYSAFNARDIDRVLVAMHADVDWPNGWEGGRVFGREGVRDYWERQWSEINPHVEPLEISLDELGRVVVKVHATVKNLAGGAISEGEVEHIYKIEDGMIKSMEIRKEQM
jgi:hypothetical protein